jgi:hypothetical protein
LIVEGSGALWREVYTRAIFFVPHEKAVLLLSVNPPMATLKVSNKA